MILVGDIGGTHTRLSVFKSRTNPATANTAATFETGRFKTLEPILMRFLSESGHPLSRIKSAVFSIAGPVTAQTARLTNKDWVIRLKDLKKWLACDNIKLINDLEAWMRAVPFLPPEDMIMLNPGKPDHKGTKACIAPGTGLGEAVMVQHKSVPIVIASEGGHADFAPCSRQQIALLQFLMDQSDHVSIERVCSGPGIKQIYDFYTHQGLLEADWITRMILSAPDPAPVISARAQLNPLESERCCKTMETFISILGTESGNLALRALATGGIYLGGGIVTQILSLLEQNHYMNAFTAKGRFTPMLKNIPVHIINNPMAALIGAASLAGSES